MGKHVDIDHCSDQTADNQYNFRHGYRVLLAEDDYEMRKLIA